MKKKYFISVYLLLIFVAAKAQGDMMMYTMRELYQSSYLNPAFMPSYNLSVGVPVLSNQAIGFQLGGFTVGNITNNIADGYLNLTNFSKDLNSNIVGIKLYSQTDIFHVNQQFGHYQIGLHSSVKTNTETAFSKDFIGFLAEGNGYFAGQDISFTGTNIQSTSYIETGISVAREFEKFTIGARLKLLNGIANVSTSNININYHTGASSFEQSSVLLGGSMNTSGLPYLQDSINGKKNTDTSFSSSNIKPFDNLGWSFDLGGTYNITPRLKLSLSAIDIGAINWKNRTYNYDLNNVDITFKGFTYMQAKDSATRVQFADSLKNLVKTHSSQNAYSTPLVSRFFVGADYDLSFRNRVGFMFQLQYYINTYIPSYTFSYSHKFGTNWSVHTNYSYYNNTFANLGLGTSIKWGAFQIYVMQDDILLYFSPSNARTAYIRFGCNLVWGAHRARARY